MYTKSFLFVPLNMGKIMTALQRTVTEHNAAPLPQDAMILSRDISPWKAEQLYHVIAPIEGFDTVALSGTFLSKVFEGPYKDAKKWYDTMQRLAADRGKSAKETYMFYTTCPKCAKHYGKNYTIGLIHVV